MNLSWHISDPSSHIEVVLKLYRSGLRTPSQFKNGRVKFPEQSASSQTYRKCRGHT